MVMRKNAIITGILLLILTTAFILLNTKLFFGSISNNGETHIELNYSDQPKIDEIKSIISISSGMREDTIKVKQSNGKMDIKFDAVELEVVDSIELMMNQAFGDTVRVDSTSIIDKPTRTFAYYIIIILTVSLILVSILIIIMNSVLILKSRV